MRCFVESSFARRLSAFCMNLLLCGLLVGALPQIAGAQDLRFPEAQRITVNDYAQVLPPSDLEALHETLVKLRQETGVEMTVLTLPKLRDYTPDLTLEAYATQLFNHWGIGDKTRNDGVLVLILRDDRHMRIELGKAYGRDWDRAAAKVINRHFLDAFAAGDYPRGIREGTQAVIDDIILPFQDPANDGAPRRSWMDRLVPVLVAAIFGIGAIQIFFGRVIGDAIRRCPQCKKRGVARTSEIVTQPTRNIPGWGKRHYQCQHCAASWDESFPVSVKSRNSNGSGGSFGGGSSGGGGASGRW